MIVLRSIDHMRSQGRRLRRQNKIIGFVPTMGSFHEGHLSLMRLAKRQCDSVVVSLFVNPGQFGPKEDFSRYPKNTKEDFKKARDLGVDFLFLPTARQIYPSNYLTWIQVKELDNILEGARRPGHFTGVATIVLKLFNIVKPHKAYFGLKDYQQMIIIRQMVRDLNLGVKLIPGQTIREKNGLAMSSRNRYLSLTERRSAPILWKTLCAGKRMIQEGLRNSSKIRVAMMKQLSEEPKAKLDYVTIVDPLTLKEVKTIKKPVLLALAVQIGRTRLIDNIMVKPP